MKIRFLPFVFVCRTSIQKTAPQFCTKGNSRERQWQKRGASVLGTTLLFAGMMATATFAQRAPAAATACTAATAACTEWVTLHGGPARSMIYRTYSLDVRNDKITRALIMVHGTNRNADHYFTTATAAAFLAGALEDTSRDRAAHRVERSWMHRQT